MFTGLPYPPADYHICPCCGTEFGNDDAHFTHQQLREMWIGDGAHWFFGNPPPLWNPQMQLVNAGFGVYVTAPAQTTVVGELSNLPSPANLPSFYSDFRVASATAISEPIRIEYGAANLELAEVA
jgi:hypothetical protein